MAATAAWVVTAVVTALVFHLGRAGYPNVPVSDVTLLICGYALGGGVTLVALRRALRDLWSKRLGYLLTAAAAVMCIGISVNIEGYLSPEGSWTDPVFPAYTDIIDHYSAADEVYHHRDIVMHNQGYPLMVGMLMRVFGTGLSAPLILNMMLMLVGIACSARLSAILIDSSDKKKLAFWGALLCGSIGSILWYSTMLMKEAGVVAGTGLFCVGIASLSVKRKMSVGAVVCVAAGSLLLLLLKSPLGWFCAAGVVILFTRWQRGDAAKYQWLYRRGILLMLICAAIIAGGSRLRYAADSSFVTASTASDPDKDMQFSMLGYNTVQKYATLIPGYFERPLWQRAAILPMTAAAQYFPPFPWNYMRDSDLSNFVWCAHLQEMWYVTGGLILGYFVLCFGRRRKSGGLSRWALWWAVCWLGVALASGGTVARYWLPFVPMGIPLALQCVRAVRNGIVKRRAFVGWSVAYGVMLIGGLIAAYRFLN